MLGVPFVASCKRVSVPFQVSRDGMGAQEPPQLRGLLLAAFCLEFFPLGSTNQTRGVPLGYLSGLGSRLNSSEAWCLSL